jgi:hypothetical protein
MRGRDRGVNSPRKCAAAPIGGVYANSGGQCPRTLQLDAPVRDLTTEQGVNSEKACWQAAPGDFTPTNVAALRGLIPVTRVTRTWLQGSSADDALALDRARQSAWPTLPQRRR